MNEIKKIEYLVPLASWVTTQDIFKLKEFAPYAKAAIIHGLHCTGSAALGDTGGELKVGDELHARFFNSKLGAATVAAVEEFPKHYQRIGAVRIGSDWSLFPTVDATTNGVYLALWLTE